MQMKRFMFATTLALSFGVSAHGATNAPVTATGPSGGDAAVVLDDTTLWRQFHVDGAAHVRNADGTLARGRIEYGNLRFTADSDFRVRPRI
jgi:hypothetical protein